MSADTSHLIAILDRMRERLESAQHGNATATREREIRALRLVATMIAPRAAGATP